MLWSALLLALMAVVSFVSARENVYIHGRGVDQVKRQLDVSRYPALYTGDFEDCFIGPSVFNISKFDAGYYADNLTVLFHLDGITRVRDESLMSMSFPTCTPTVHHVD